MDKIREIHNKAMELAALADLQKGQGNKYEATSLFEDAYSLEREAAMYAFNENIGEPTVSILLRSAASLAMSCNKLREAEKLIALAISGDPPSEIAEELRNLNMKIIENLLQYRKIKVINDPVFALV